MARAEAAGPSCNGSPPTITTPPIPTPTSSSAAGAPTVRDLVIPKDFIKYGMSGIARDVATSGSAAAPADERRALDREVIRHAPTRLDRMIANQLPEDRTIRVAALKAPNGDRHHARHQGSGA
ncbi:MAG: hypothetical protein R3C25_00335 [Hyphomonadaceae bacterium]